MNEKEQKETEVKNGIEITVKKDIEADLALIGKWFADSDSPHFKERILYFYKTLGKKLEDFTDEPEKVVEDYFREIYASKEKEIDEIVEESKRILEEESPASLAVLADLMDYDPEKGQKFIAIPTLLPYSPFHEPVFNFSIVGKLFLGKKNEVLDTAIHEISHFLLFDILKDLNIDLADKRSLEHMFKEALTGMLLSEPELENLLNRKNYLGNPEIQNLFIKDGDEKEVILREYLRSEFRNHKARGLSFSDFIKAMMEKFLPKASEFYQKKTFWDKNEQELKAGNSELLEIYSEPIKI
ncbi:MAG: hypothetical protein WCW56_01465 [Candidatus Paceibacterota bacterium]|jgi:hypothetical protein